MWLCVRACGSLLSLIRCAVSELLFTVNISWLSNGIGDDLYWFPHILFFSNKLAVSFCTHKWLLHLSQQYYKTDLDCGLLLVKSKINLLEFDLASEVLKELEDIFGSSCQLKFLSASLLHAQGVKQKARQMLEELLRVGVKGIKIAGVDAEKVNLCMRRLGCSGSVRKEIYYDVSLWGKYECMCVGFCCGIFFISASLHAILLMKKQVCDMKSMYIMMKAPYHIAVIFAGRAWLCWGSSRVRSNLLWDWWDEAGSDQLHEGREAGP